MEGNEPGAVHKRSQTTFFHAGGQSLILGLGIVAVLLLIAVTLVILRRLLTEKETGGDRSPTPPPVSPKVVEPSGPTPFASEEDMTTEGPGETDLKDVEIL